MGDFRRIRIPKTILEQCEMTDVVELTVRGGQIVLSAAQKQPRDGWREEAARMAAAGDDDLLIPDVFEGDVTV